MAYLLHRHKKDQFRSRVKSLPALQYDGVPSQPRVVVQIRYDLTRCRGRLSDEDPSQEVIFDRSVDRRDGACQAFLSDVVVDGAAFALLSPELSRIGVRRGRRKGIAKKVANCARLAALAAGDDDELGRARLVVIPIVVELLRARSKWVCDGCLRERKRKASIKMILSKGDRDVDDDDRRRCAVCLGGFGAVKGAVSVPCSHEFHAKCILTWLLRSSSCPLCRFQMPI